MAVILKTEKCVFLSARNQLIASQQLCKELWWSNFKNDTKNKHFYPQQHSANKMYKVYFYFQNLSK